MMRMFKSIKVTEDVYSFLKERSIQKKKSLSDVIREMYSTSHGNQTTESRLDEVESKINLLMSYLELNIDSNELKTKNERPSRDLNPSRSLDRAGRKQCLLQLAPLAHDRPLHCFQHQSE